jgi:hypothetical protein
VFVVATQLPHIVPRVLHDGKEGGPAGAHTSFGALGVTVRAPNWSFNTSPGNVALGHFTL